MKILLLGDTSNFHETLGQGLKALGHSVTVASDGTCWMNTRRDIDLSRRAGKLGGLALWLKMRWLNCRDFAGYDVVSLSGTHFAELHPSRLRSIFDYVRRNNGKVFVTALATETFFIDECLDAGSALRYNEWRIGDEPTEYSRQFASIADAWRAPLLRDYCTHIYNNVDGAVAALYEYYVSCHRALPPEKIGYGGIPVDTDSISYADNDPGDGKVRLFLGYPKARMLEKGADRLLEAARRVVADYPDKCELDVVSNVPLSEFMKRLRSAHVVIDQLYSYTPATTALMAMAMGKTVLTGAEPEFYEFIGEKDLKPMVNVVPDDRLIYEAIKEVVLYRQQLVPRGAAAREFVERHNAATVVAQRFLDFWSR